MDRRTVIFIVTLSLAFFGIQYTFSHFDGKNRELVLQKKIEFDAKKKETFAKEIAEKKASLSDLHAYASSDGTVFAVEDSGFFVTLALNEDELKPSLQLIPSSDGKSSIDTKLVCRFEEFALYKSSAVKARNLIPPTFAKIGHFDIQLISLQDSLLKVTLAEIDNGKVDMIESPVYTAAIASIKTKDGYQPVGYYDPETATILTFSQIPGWKEFVTEETVAVDETPLKEEYFVLENSYQQIVFSNKGGSIIEINLPFQTNADKLSAVLSTNVDRELIKQSPENALFPLVEAKQYDGSKIERRQGGFYPLLRRQINNSARQPISSEAARFYSCNIVSDYPEVANLIYKVKQFTDTEITFEAKQPHRRITKTFSLPKNPQETPYCFNISVVVEGDSRGLFLSSGLLEAEWISGAPAPMIQYLIRKNNTNAVEKIDLPKEIYTLTSTTPDWICNSNGFFGIIIDPLEGSDSGFKAEKISGIIAPSRLTLIDKSSERYKAQDIPSYEIFLPIKQNAKRVDIRFFAGPFADNVLKTIDTHFAESGNGLSSDYIACQTFHGWFAFISEPFAKFLFILMNFFHNLFGSWALSIVLVTVVLRLLLYPLNSWSMKSMKGMQIVAPKIKAIQEKYKKEPQKAQLEILALYKEYKVNPLSGCLPLILQMPFLIGMFDLLKSTFELRGAPFISGWIDDLAQPDVLFSWNYSLPIIGNQFHLLPIILGGIMYVQQIMSANLPKDQSQWTDQQRQQRSMGLIMTAVMTVMFYQFPSGLNIYWISSMLLGIFQQWWTNKMIDKKSGKASAMKETIVKPKFR